MPSKLPGPVLGTAAQPAPIGNWLGIQLAQGGANRSAVGAWIDVQIGTLVTRRELSVGGGHAGGQWGWSHFGLGSAQAALVRVQWPDGTLGSWQPVDANQFVVIDRDTGQVRPWPTPH
jgi:hypothetical protein